jgi:hypothetical protein
MIAKTFATKVLVTEAFALEQDAYRAVENRDPLLEQLIEALPDRGRDCHG